MIDEEINRVLSQFIHQAAYERSYGTRADLYRFILDHFSYHAERIPYLSPGLMPPCGNCHECSRTRLPQKTSLRLLIKIIPTLGR